ncbi:mechanosensitive ion channel family protein [Halobellus captivus]|uniref:mechanosensitive ion channel family protein n=1 Tax=Halobellus captivus TaxID=2592614 RepID=UPI001EF0DF87|nr:mechanosensitive ion channel family protein [Halobellus captivus]
MLSELFGPTLSTTAQIVPPGLFDGVVTESYADLARGLVGFAVAATVAYSLGRLVVIPLTVRVVAARNRNNPTIATATRTYAHAIIVAVAVLVGIAGAGLWSLLTNLSIVVAALTLVVGAASQDVVGSLTSGLFLVSDPDFNVGDWIAWPGGEGIVEEIDFRVTRVRTLNNETITVPNTELTANALTRPYGRDRYRVVEAFEIGYDDDVELALRELVEVARDDDRILEEPTPTAMLDALGSSSVRLHAVCWIGDPMDVDLMTLRSDLRRRVKSRFDEIDVTLGPPSARELSGSVSVDVEKRNATDERDGRDGR